MPATDFWGRPVAKDKPPALGAFAFVPFLATEQARVGWYYNWAYRFAPASGLVCPICGPCQRGNRESSMLSKAAAVIRSAIVLGLARFLPSSLSP